MNDTDAEALVKLAVARDDLEAGLWRDALQQEGIPVYLRNADPLGSIGAAPSLPFSLELFVLAKDELQARQVLAELKDSRP